MFTTRSPRRRADKGRRAQLISAARAVMAREGVAAATTRRITEEAGLPHGSFHYWFAGKEELLQQEQLFEELVAKSLRDMTDSAAARAADTASGAGASLGDLLRAAFDVVERDEQIHPGYQLAGYELTTLALRTPALRDLARRQYQAYRDTAAAITACWMAGRRVDLPGGPGTLNQLLAVLFDGLVLAWLADPDGTDPGEMLTLIDALVEGHTTRPDAPGARSPVPSDPPAAIPANTRAPG
jgi:AcrR family transcriptional regulator